MAPPALIILRPEPGNTATRKAAQDLGLDAYSHPLFEVVAEPWQRPSGPFDAILAGSANIFRHAGPGLASFAAVPVMAVGATTAQAARAAGFAVSAIGEGGLQPMVEALPPGNYLRLAGKDRVTLTPPAGVQIITEVVYAAKARRFDAALISRLAQSSVILLHSGEAARHFRSECERVEIRKENIHLACLAARIADNAGPGWARIEIAGTRNDADLLALAARMCQTV